MILVDTSGVLALVDRGEREHGRARAAVGRHKGPLVVTDFVLAEADYLLLRRLGPAAARAFIEQVLDGVFLREPVTDADLRQARAIAARYPDQELGLTDATLMALAERLTRRVLTLDRRHFAIFRDRHGRPLDLLPA